MAPTSPEERPLTEQELRAIIRVLLVQWQASLVVSRMVLELNRLAAAMVAVPATGGGGDRGMSGRHRS